MGNRDIKIRLVQRFWEACKEILNTLIARKPYVSTGSPSARWVNLHVTFDFCVVTFVSDVQQGETQTQRGSRKGKELTA